MQIENNERRIKVLFLAGWYPNEDNPVSGIFIKRHAEAVSRYCDVAVLYIHNGTSRKETTVEYTLEDTIKTFRVYAKSTQIKNRILRFLANRIYQNFFLCSYKGLKVIQKEFGRPEIIHVHVTLPMGILAVMLNVLAGIPFIITEHFSDFLHQTKNPLSYIQLKMILQKSKCICPVSNSLKLNMEEFYWCNNYQVIPNVINTDFFTPGSLKNKQVKKQIIHVSLLNDKQKNITGILSAIHELSKKREDFELHIIGDGIDRAKIEDLAIELGIKDKLVFFHGFIDNNELLNPLQNSDFFVLNSNYETFSVVCAEALAAGIPVLSTRCGGPEDFINENVGILIEKGNRQELIQAINYMLDNSEKYDPWALHEYIKGRFGYEKVGKEFYEQYLKVLT